VFDDEYRNAFGYLLDQPRDAFAFCGGEAGQRFVEQKHLRFAAERNAEIDKALAAIRQIASEDVLDSFKA
jgi:hypothetical protein